MSNKSIPANDFLRACKLLPVERRPVWFMRQAGRYMPEYRAIRERVGFLEACKTPDIAVEITLQPVRALGVDAAILFSDIMITAEGMGVSVEFAPGPQLAEPIRSRAQIEALKTPDPHESVPYVLETLRRLRSELPTHVALIGFCGAPWTLANYFVQGGSAKEFTRMKRLLYEDAEAGQLLLSKLASANAAYLGAQIEAGAQAVQIFDTWAGLLDPDDYAHWALPYVRQMIAEVRSGNDNVPIVYFARDAWGAAEHLRTCGADALSIDWRVPLDVARHTLGSEIAVQGNLDPAALFAPWPVLRQRADAVLARAGDVPGHIFNLGHGILPETPVDNVRHLVEYVHERTSQG